MGRIFGFLVFLALLILLDNYAYQGVKTATDTIGIKTWIRGAYWGVHILFYFSFIGIIVAYNSGGWMGPKMFNAFITVLTLLYLPKIFLALVLFGEDVFRLGKWGVVKSMDLVKGPDVVLENAGEKISRSKFISMAALGVASIPFATLVYGMLRTKYDFMVTRFKIPVKDLPAAFEGMTFTQISDLHTGSFDNRSAVKRGIDLVNAQNSDVILFTGDLVNHKADEVDGWEDIYASLKAPMGVYSVLGNHDYGDYVRNWQGNEKAENFSRFVKLHESLGWKLMRNENVIFDKEGEKLALLGVENWSNRMGFHNYGDLEIASRGTDGIPKILMSHDPSHWDGEILKKYKDIALTLSGHTHGFQMGIDIPGFKWSPVQYVYKQWAGLYKEGDQHLYVNRGFGFHAYAGRVGIRPEISVFELTRA